MIGNRLFGRVAEVEIRSVRGLTKSFSSPPFRIDLETDFDRFATTKVVLYNPNQDTLDSIESVRFGSVTRYPDIFVTAGYKDSSGLVCSGKIYKQKVYTRGADRIAELQASEQAGLWMKSVYQFYRMMPVNVILADVLGKESILIGSMRLGKTTVLNYTAKSIGRTVEDLCRISESQYYFEDGKINFIPLDGVNLPSQIVLDYTSGLIGEPEKQENKKWKIRSLFRHEFRLNQTIVVYGGKLQGAVKILKGKNRFSSHGNSSAEIEVKEI